MKARAALMFQTLSSRRFLQVAWLLAALSGAAASAAPSEAERLNQFESKVRPVLVLCYSCHSANNMAGNLRLDTPAEILKSGVSGKAAVVPGDTDKSHLLEVLREARAPSSHAVPAEAMQDLTTWIRNGAVYPPPAATPIVPPKVDDVAKAFWSFVPPAEPVVPQVSSAEWSGNPVDRFIFQKLTEKGLQPSPLASKLTLIRRATYDLIGLPPSPEEVESFLADNSPDAFARVVDRLLASPRYGEEWGRHWLDIARYADTAGESADYPIPQARLYRDWVINSFNNDKPYDQFIQEQIAGDLMPAKDDADRHQKVIATGFVALARRFSVRPENEMHLTIDDTLDTMGKGVLGLTLGCARCHDHKFDPISSKDYYALFGIFSSTRYPYAGSEERQYQAELVPIGDDAQAEVAEEKVKLEAAEAQIVKLEAAHEAEKDPGQREQLQNQLRDANKARERIMHSSVEKQYAYALQDKAQGGDARQLLRGEPGNLGDVVPRGFLRILGGQKIGPEVTGSGRLQLSRWMTDPKNPLTARVMVNRIWQYHMGQGIVQTPSDFGARGTRPTHPELLDWLAVKFVKDGWSIKSIHRAIMLSRPYQLSAASDDQRDQADPGNQWLSHFRRRRLEAESVRDSMLLASGELDLSTPGAHPFPPPQDWHFTQHAAFAATYDSRHRSVYLMQQRIRRHPFFATFDGADTNAPTAVRMQNSTPLQALWLMNDPFFGARCKALAKRLMAEKQAPVDRIDMAFRAVLCRPAEADEKESIAKFVVDYERGLGDPAPADAEQDAWESVVQALFSSNEFMFIE